MAVMVLDEEEAGALQWCLNVCESGFSNEGVTEAMNELCLFMWVGGLPFNPFSHFVQEVATAQVVMSD